jgi:hypothetical protein
MENIYGRGKCDSLPFLEEFMNEVRWSSEHQSFQIDTLIGNLAKHGATFSTTIHLFAEKLGLAYFSNPGNMPDSGLSKEIKKHNAENFKAFMLITKKCMTKESKLE